MADNLKYNEPGSGPNVATDDVGSVHFQKMKLDGGADGVSIPLTGTTEFGLLSDISRLQGSLPAGTNNIGDVDVLTLPSIPAGVNLIGQVAQVSGFTAITNGILNVGATGFTITTVSFSGTVAGATTVVSGVTNYKVRVLSLFFTCQDANSVGWKSNTTYLIPKMNFAKFGGMVANFGPSGFIMETASGAHLLIDILTSNRDVVGVLNYILVPA